MLGRAVGVGLGWREVSRLGAALLAIATVGVWMGGLRDDVEGDVGGDNEGRDAEGRYVEVEEEEEEEEEEDDDDDARHYMRLSD